MAKKIDPSDSPDGRARRRLRKLAGEAAVIAVVILLTTAVRSSLADHYHVPSGSMMPAVQIGDRIFVNKLAYGLRIPLTRVVLAELDEPSRGDVIVLESPVDGTVLLKRVVAVPGDVVSVQEGRLRLNGRDVPLRQENGAVLELLGAGSHPVSFAEGGGPALRPVLVPAGSFLVMGDNRGDSLDGRIFGFVDREAILGRTVGIFARDGRPTWLAP